MNRLQGIFHIPTGRWVIEVGTKNLKLSHSPVEINPDLVQNFGDTRLHSVMNRFSKRSNYQVKSFDSETFISIPI